MVPASSRHREPGPGPTARPRDPGQAPTSGFPARSLLAVVLAVIIVGLGGLLAADRFGGRPKAPAIPPAAEAADTARDATLALPLDPAAAGFPGGTSQEVDATQGPAAVSYCRHAPATTGIEAWRGTRLTDQAGQRRVVQLVSRFQTPQQASAYLTATSALVDCQSWQTGDKPTLRFSIAQSSSPTLYGEETRRFDLQALGDGSRYYLRSLVFRSGRQVVQLTYVSVDGTDLDALDDLAAQAATRLTP